MPKPTFDINDIVAPVGRQPANPFGLPTPAQQNPARRVAQTGGPLDITLPENPTAGDVYRILNSQKPTPTPKPQPPQYAT